MSVSGLASSSVIARPDRLAGHGPVCWTIAGTDPSGGAGIQADLKTFHGMGAYGASVITAVIAQNTMGVRRVSPVSANLVAEQLQVLAEDVPPAAVKVGMLTTGAVVRETACALSAVSAPVICDPVMGSTGGHALLSVAGVRILLEELLPRVDLLTPNIPEAMALSGYAIESEGDMVTAARKLLDMGPRWVLLKGGHGRGAVSGDVLVGRKAGPFRIWAPRLDVRHTHGTGCTLSSAIAAARAFGLDWPEACVVGRAYVQQGLRLGGGIGRGRGPLYHGGWPNDPEDFPSCVQI